MASIKIVTGRIGEKEISRFIENYQSRHSEQILTTMREIREEFEKQGYNKDLVEFNNDY